MKRSIIGQNTSAPFFISFLPVFKFRENSPAAIFASWVLLCSFKTSRAYFFPWSIHECWPDAIGPVYFFSEIQTCSLIKIGTFSICYHVGSSFIPFQHSTYLLLIERTEPMVAQTISLHFLQLAPCKQASILLYYDARDHFEFELLFLASPRSWGILGSTCYQSPSLRKTRKNNIHSPILFWRRQSTRSKCKSFLVVGKKIVGGNLGYNFGFAFCCSWMTLSSQSSQRVWVWPTDFC